MASHLVAVIDGLEKRNVRERRANPNDRRAHALYLTRRGRAVLGEMEHETVLTEGLSMADRRTLEELLARIAHHEGLALGSHPGFDEEE